MVFMMCGCMCMFVRVCVCASKHPKKYFKSALMRGERERRRGEKDRVSLPAYVHTHKHPHPHTHAATHPSDGIITAYTLVLDGRRQGRVHLQKYSQSTHEGVEGLLLLAQNTPALQRCIKGTI